MANLKTKIAGLYGLPGAGKTTLLNQLKAELPHDQIAFYEGSEVFGNLVSGGLEALHGMEEDDKLFYRQQTIIHIKVKCA